MSNSHLTKLRMAALAAMICTVAGAVAAAAAVLAQGAGARGQGAPTGRGQAPPETPSAMVNPYRMVETGRISERSSPAQPSGSSRTRPLPGRRRPTPQLPPRLRDRLS